METFLTDFFVSLQGSERASALARIKYKSYSAVVEVDIKLDDRDVFGFK